MLKLAPRLTTFVKVGLYLLSLWLLLVLVIVNKVSIDICLDCSFATRTELKNIVYNNILPCIATILLIISLAFRWYFLHLIEGAKHGPVVVKSVENKSAEHLVFLATYVIPLVSFGLNDTRQIISLAITLTLLGAIYVRTNLFYANPTLSLLGFKIFNVEISGSGIEEKCTLISKNEIELGSTINVMHLDAKVYLANKAIEV
jgi:hypothetical protein